MQLVDSKLCIANLAPAHVPTCNAAAANTSPFALGRTGFVAGCRSDRKLRTVGGRGRTGCNLVAQLRETSAAERLLMLMLAAFVVTASPAVLSTVRTTIAIALQILVQIGHLAFIAFQIFGR